MPIERIQPDGLSRPARYTQVVKAGNTVYIAGQTAVDASGNVVGVGDIEAQTVQVLQNIQTALASVGASLDNVVKATTYLINIEDIEGYRRVRQRYTQFHGSAGALLILQALASPEYLIEIEAVAVVE